MVSRTIVQVVLENMSITKELKPEKLNNHLSHFQTTLKIKLWNIIMI